MPAESHDTMPITTFYSEVLGANLANARWSWGAYDPMKDHLYLRVWSDEIETSDGVDRVLLLDHSSDTKSAGKNERHEHIQRIADGSPGFGVVCEPTSSRANGSRSIRSFNRHSLLRLGTIQVIGDRTYASISATVPVHSLTRKPTSLSTLPGDLKGLLNGKLPDSTIRHSLIQARVGQGIFREKVLQLWDHRCAVSAAVTSEAIRASHIKPWKHSSDRERLDPYNGLPLIANLDALFDSGLMTFGDDGEMLLSSRLRADDHSLLGVGDGRLRRPPPPQMLPYLRAHRKTQFIP
jgi:putative restriction endonuclease